MDILKWWLSSQNPGYYFLNHVIMVERLRSLLPWKLSKLIYEGSDYDINTENPEITEMSVFKTECELLYNDKIFTTVNFMCFEDLQCIRLELESNDSPAFFLTQNFSFEFINNSYKNLNVISLQTMIHNQTTNLNI